MSLPEGFGQCPTCGSVLSVYTGDEGTSSYEPANELEHQATIERFRESRDETLIEAGNWRRAYETAMVDNAKLQTENRELRKRLEQATVPARGGK